MGKGGFAARKRVPAGRIFRRRLQGDGTIRYDRLIWHCEGEAWREHVTQKVWCQDWDGLTIAVYTERPHGTFRKGFICRAYFRRTPTEEPAP